MKRLAELVLALFITLVGCEEEPFSPVIPPVEPQREKTITINATAGVNGNIEPSGVTSLKVGDSKIYTIKANDNYSIFTVKINGVDVLPVNNTIEIKALVSGDIKEIKVEFIFTDALLVSKASWYLRSYKYIQDGLVVDDSPLSDEQKSKQYQFKLDGKVYLNGNFSCNWSFVSGRILVGDQDCSYALTDKEFVRSMASQYYNKPAIFEVTYWRP